MCQVEHGYFYENPFVILIARILWVEKYVVISIRRVRETDPGIDYKGS